MTQGSMREYTEAVRGRYLRASKKEKSRILKSQLEQGCEPFHQLIYIIRPEHGLDSSLFSCYDFIQITVADELTVKSERHLLEYWESTEIALLGYREQWRSEDCKD